jgi:hypothetical protein
VIAASRTQAHTVFPKKAWFLRLGSEVRLVFARLTKTPEDAESYVRRLLEMEFYTASELLKGLGVFRGAL